MSVAGGSTVSGSPSSERVLRAVIEITRQIGAGRDLETIFGTVAEELAELLPYDRCSIGLVDSGGEKLRIIGLRGRRSVEFREGLVALAGTVGEWCIDECRPLIYDLSAEDRFLEDSLRRAIGIQQLALAPIVVDNKPIGVLTLSSARPNTYRADQLWLLQTIGDHLGLAIAATNLRDDAERRAARAQFLAETGQIFASSLDLEQTLRRAMGRASAVLGDFNIVYLVDEENGAFLRTREVTHPNPDVEAMALAYIRENPPQPGGPLTGPPLRGEPLLVPSVPADFLLPRARPFAEAIGIHSLLSVPLMAGGRVIGVFVSFSTSDPARQGVRRTLNAEDLALAQDLAAQIASAIENARLHAATQRALEESEALRRIGQELTSSIELEQTLDLVASFARLLLGADYAAVAGEGADGAFSWRSVIGQRTDAHREFGHNPSDGPVARAMATRKMVVVDYGDPDFTDHESAIHRAEGAQVVLAVPLVVGERASGALVLGYRSAHDVTPADSRLAAALAAQAALVLENARLFDSAQRALAARDEFLSIAAHELRTPLTTLRGRIQLLQRRLTGTIPAQDLESISIMRRQMDRLTRMVNDLLDLSRLSAGRLLPQPERVDLVTLGRVATEEFATAQHPIHFMPTETELIGYWDPWQLDQVLANLLSNAIRYSPPGSPITVRASRDGDVAQLDVIDRGSGIPAAELDRIFERFYRGKQQDRAGFGLGLSICRQIIADHGGSLVGFSAGPGTGATFTIRLPLGDGPLPSAKN